MPEKTTWRCPCGGAYDLDGLADPAITRRVAELSMGEGGTPLVAVTLAGRVVHAKVEYLSPTLSFKDRGAVWLVAAALELGAERVIADSSGNAGTAVAAYAARAGMRADVFVPASASPGKVAPIEAHGARLHRIEGTREAAAWAAVQEVERSGAFYASHVWNPLFFEGTKQLVHELDALPDVLLLPVGNGTLVLGAVRALAERGATATRVVGVRAPDGTIAEGIAISDPPRAAQVRAAIEASGGSMVVVNDEEITAAQHALAAQGFFVEPTAAVPAAAVPLVDAAARIVIPLAGAGLKAQH